MDHEIPQSYDLIDPGLITVNRPDRQRQSIDTEGLISSIRQIGVINPIIVRRTEETLVLVAGERRLECCRELKIPVPVRYWDELSPTESRVIELEENIKRADLPWRDYALAVHRLHTIWSETDSEWNQKQTAAALSFSEVWISRVLTVARAVESDNPRIAQCGSIDAAHSILARLSERRAALIVQELIEEDESHREDESPSSNPVPQPYIEGNHSQGNHSQTLVPSISHKNKPPYSPILVTDFLQWAPTYSGPKFNVIHLDFPYGGAGSVTRQAPDVYTNTRDVFWDLTDCFLTNLDRIASYSAHILFWFTMRQYTDLRRRFLENDIHTPFYPLIWVKPNPMSIVGWLGGVEPHRVYETCLIGARGGRRLVKNRNNAYSAPRVSNPIHPTQKSEPMLRYFLSMVVDDTTDFIDPTAGSGSSIRAAEDLGARSTLGLEINPEYAAIANLETNKARNLRILNKRIVAEDEGEEETSQ